MIKNLSTLAERLAGVKIGDKEVTPESLLEAIKSDSEVELSVGSVTMLNDQQLSDLKTTLANGSMKDGVIAGAEQTMKALKKQFELSYEGKIFKDSEGKIDFEKTTKELADNLAPSFEEKLKLPVDKKVKDLTESLERLQGNYERDIKERDNTINSLKSDYDLLNEQTFVSGFANKVEGHNPKHLYAAFKADGYGTELVDGKRLPTLNGKVINDNVEKPLGFENVFNDWLTKNNYISGEKGRGGGTEQGGTGGKFRNTDDAVKYMRDNNINPASEQGQKILSGLEES